MATIGACKTQDAIDRAEAILGCPLDGYLIEAATLEKSASEMQRESGLSRHTISGMLRGMGYEPVMIWRRKR